MPATLPKLPFGGFPLRPHRNGQWYKSVWNPRTKRTEQFYFGRWADDSTGERAISDPISGWLARRDASPTFKALILLGINCGMGPADLGRLTWDRIDLSRGRLNFPRPKTGVMRVGYLWKRTRLALQRVRSLKHNRTAIDRDGAAALVFITRKGLPYYRERELYTEMEVSGRLVQKLKGVAVDNAISITFSRLAGRAELEGVTFYRLRHTFKTLGKKARDREVVDLMMGHKDTSMGKIYDHEEICWRRVRRVARIVYRQLWPKIKQSADRKPTNMTAGAAGAEAKAA